MAKILCIDDDRDILDTCEVVLEGQGHKIETAINGKEGYFRVTPGTPEECERFMAFIEAYF